ncbi:MAG: DUF2213 domain-containing protein [PVC group bacterium]|nr:DUF2213 domain-containing protein [PVC group bacterium]
MEITDAVKRKYTECLRRQKSLGLSGIEAQIHCANLLLKDGGKEKTSHNLQLMWGTDFEANDDIKLSKQVPKTEANVSGEESGRVTNISLSKFATIIKLVKNKIPLKTEHMAQGSLKPLLPMKNFNILQTKLEKLFTEESKNLTAEELTQRGRYATLMKKDFMDGEVSEKEMDILVKEMYDYLETLEDISYDDKTEMLFDYLIDPIVKEQVWVDSQVEVGKVNLGMNNIIKAPIILAREMVQKYTFRDNDGSEREEFHFKPYKVLEDSIKGLDILYMILEHKETWEMSDTLGCVRQLKADPKIRGIRGMGYFVRKNLPVAIADALDNGETISVSIGFMADLMKGGTFNGKEYDFTQTNIILDHLAVCLESKPRCPDDLCGVNVKEFQILDNGDYTLLNESNYYYNINSNIDTIEETSNKNIKEENSKQSDSMEDSFPDKTSGLTAGGEEPDFEAFLSGLRKFMGGVTDPDEKAVLRRRILRTMNLTDDETEIVESKEDKKGEQEMDEKEFQDAIAAKDKDLDDLRNTISELNEEKRQGLIVGIKGLSDAYSDEELEKSDIPSLKIITDAVSRFKPSEAKTPVVPIAPKSEELKKEIEDSEEVKRENPSEIFSKINEKFNLSSVE